MSPEVERASYPFCLARVAIRSDGKFRRHDFVPKRRHHCSGSDRTPEEAKAAKGEGLSSEVLSGRPDSIEPEDIF